jgi:GrpB-like predicted nucleotidyltransferase (UPF0157 family)
VQLHRFGEDHLLPVRADGSSFLAGGLARGGPVEVSVLHLRAGGLVGRHAAPVRRLLCVVEGEGWASGSDGERRRIRRADAACWEAGEEGEAGSESGLTAICVDGELEVLARSVLREIEIVDYDPAWVAWFDELRAFVWPAVADLAVRIDHVGSTSVPGLAAKPIIDMDVVLQGEEDAAPAIERLRSIGYRWIGELGIAGRQAFAPESVVPELPPHNLYVVVEDNRAHLDHWLLRDLLREDGEARRRYGELKRRNAELARGDIDAYTEAKAALVAELLTRARAERGLEPVEYWNPGGAG